MPKTLFTEGRLQSFERMMQQVPVSNKNQIKQEDEQDDKTDNAKRDQEGDRP